MSCDMFPTIILKLLLMEKMKEYVNDILSTRLDSVRLQDQAKHVLAPNSVSRILLGQKLGYSLSMYSLSLPKM